jgi:hypothetical protein
VPLAASALAHPAPVRLPSSQPEQRLGEPIGIPDRHLQTILAVRHELAAARHVRRHRRETHGRRLEQHAARASPRPHRTTPKSWMPWIPPRAVLDTLSADGAGLGSRQAVPQGERCPPAPWDPTEKGASCRLPSSEHG